MCPDERQASNAHFTSRYKYNTTTTTKTTKKWKSAEHSIAQYSTVQHSIKQHERTVYNVQRIANEEIADAKVKGTDDGDDGDDDDGGKMENRIHKRRMRAVTVYVRIHFPCAQTRAEHALHCGSGSRMAATCVAHRCIRACVSVSVTTKMK